MVWNSSPIPSHRHPTPLTHVWSRERQQLFCIVLYCIVLYCICQHPTSSSWVVRKLGRTLLILEISWLQRCIVNLIQYWSKSIGSTFHEPSRHWIQRIIQTWKKQRIHRQRNGLSYDAMVPIFGPAVSTKEPCESPQYTNHFFVASEFLLTSITQTINQPIMQSCNHAININVL